MIDKRILLEAIETLPPHAIDEVYDYVVFIKQRKGQEPKIADITLASEKVLSKDWLSPEEDAAWANL